MDTRLIAPMLAVAALVSAATPAAAQGTPDPVSQDYNTLNAYIQDLAAKSPAATPTARPVGKIPANRGAIALKDDYYGDSATSIIFADQGPDWTPELTQHYYFTSQGSELADYDIFVNLEQAASTELFRDPKFMSKFRYLPQEPSDLNPYGLPAGFTLTKRDDGPNQVGLTCSACHTAQINYKGTGIRVDGAPAMADMVGFLEELSKALNAALNDPQKYQRLSDRVLGKNPPVYFVDQFKQRLTSSRDFIDTYNKTNATHVPYGFSRVDAVGRIYNQVLTAVQSTTRLTPDAPVSYPFLWDAPHHDYVQWIGLTPNAGAGAIGRNAGEVVGVFGKVEVTKANVSKIKGYPSSVDADALVSFEQWLWKMQSPKWPETVLPAPDQAKAARGKQVYNNQCISCHHTIDRASSTRKVAAQMYDVDIVATDRREIDNALQPASSGVLEGRPTSPFGKETFGASTAVAGMLTNVVMGVLLDNIRPTIDAVIDANTWGNGLVAPPKQGQYPVVAGNPYASLAAYKARPLNGIWATAPYLHNGSVPTLYDLLLPPAQRPKSFGVGWLEFDPQNVGYKHDTKDAPSLFDTSLTGNGNGGHEYGTTLSEEDRRALVEYLKTL